MRRRQNSAREARLPRDRPDENMTPNERISTSCRHEAPNGYANGIVCVDEQILRRIRDLRKRRGPYRSNERAARELQRVAALLPAGSLEREIFERAEMRGATYKAIAAAINVSERHMYRIRRRMIEMIDGDRPALDG